MLGSKNTQFTLSPDGKILWQEKLNNPLPGVEVASLVKGEHPLKPMLAVTPNEITQKHDAQRVTDELNLWFNSHMMAVLEPLVMLGIKTGEINPDDPVEQISQKIYDNLGIIPRENLEDIILKLDPEKRAVLRNKKIRLGPILVFIPALNKPAAVRLRALLWSLYHGLDLPAKVPGDGIVSQKIAQENINEDFYRAIGYPIYGDRAVRIDMLDRVISSVYDHAKDGEFEARHEMAEWLGAPIDDLYKILESMGHRKISDPAETPVTEAVSETPASEAVPLAETVAETPAEKKPENVKPALARFRLKKGKAFEKNKPHEKKPFEKKEKKQFTKPDKVKGESSFKKPYDKKDGERPKHKKKFDKHPKEEREPRIVSFEAKKKEDSPFAILQQLKTKSDG